MLIEPATVSPQRTARPAILIVCTGNVCRSPATQFLLRPLLGAWSDSFQIESAGTSAVDGAPMDPVIGGLLQDRGTGYEAFSARSLTVGMVASADLVLTASTSHRATVARLLPAAVHKTLTVRQLARYAPFILERGAPPPTPEMRIPWLLAGVPHARARGRHGDDSVADPKGRSRRHYLAAFQELDRACSAIAPLLRAGFARPSAVDALGMEALPRFAAGAGPERPARRYAARTDTTAASERWRHVG